MDAQTFKYPAAKQEAQDGEYPEISSPSCMLEEPGFHKKRISVSGNNIVHRIQFQDRSEYPQSQRARNSGIFEERRNANQSNRGKLPGRIRCCKEGNEVGGV